MAILSEARSAARSAFLISLIAAAGLSFNGSAANSSEKQQFAPAIPDISITLPHSPSAPARFFTINQIMSLHDRGIRPDQPVRLASVNPTEALRSDSPATPHLEDNDEPFSLRTFRAPEGLLWVKWRKLHDELRDDARVISDCRGDRNQCTSPAALYFLALVDQARSTPKRAQIGTLNRSINLAIRYVSDLAQYGVLDLWSAPLATLTSGKGDCEDYAIVKYMALRELGMNTEDLRLVLARDRRLRLDHAVLAVRYEDRWLILDNRSSQLVDADEVPQLTPLFSLGSDGVKLFAAPYAKLPPRQTIEVATRLISPLK